MDLRIFYFRVTSKELESSLVKIYQPVKKVKLKGNLMGVLHSFSIKNIFYDKTDLRLFYFHVTCLEGSSHHT